MESKSDSAEYPSASTAYMALVIERPEDCIEEWRCDEAFTPAPVTQSAADSRISRTDDQCAGRRSTPRIHVVHVGHGSVAVRRFSRTHDWRSWAGVHLLLVVVGQVWVWRRMRSMRAVVTMVMGRMSMSRPVSESRAR